MDFRRPQAWEADSEIALRDYTGEVGEEPGYIGIFAANPVVGTLKDYCLFCFFLLRGMWDLSSLTRIEPMPTAVEAQSLIHSITREVPKDYC